MPTYPKNIVRDFMDKHPNGTYREFVQETKCQMVPSNFTYIRRKYRKEKAGVLPLPSKTGKRSYVRRASPVQVYERVWFHSTENLPKEAIDVVRNLVQEMNHSKRQNWELIELANPKQIEIREHTK